MDIMNKDDSRRKIKFWIGVLLGISLISIVFIPIGVGFKRISPFIYLGIVGAIVGYLAGNDIKEGAKAGFLAGITTIILIFFKGLIFDFSSAYSYYSSITLTLFLAGMLDLIIIIVVPVAMGGVIGGWIRQMISRIRIL